MTTPAPDPREVFKLLRAHYGSPPREYFVASLVRDSGGTLFEILVSIVLSQNSSDKNALKAYRNIANALGGRVDPENLLGLDRELLEELVRPAGMWRLRAARLQRIASKILEVGGVEKILEMGCEDARRILVSIDGIGDKTADVLLVNTRGCPYFPVDTHISRISRRLGIVGLRARYDEISRAWASRLDAKDYLEAHMILIHHGRVTCKARRPLCNICPLDNVCPKIL